jgi:hypothetical protein
MVPVSSFEVKGVSPDPNLPIRTTFPVVVGTVNELNFYAGSIPKADAAERLGLRKPAYQHHRSAIVALDDKPIEIKDNNRQLLLSAKGANMSWPHIGLTSNTDNRAYPYTFRLVSVSEIGNQFKNMNELRDSGVVTERVIGCFALEEYIVDGRHLTHEEFAANAVRSYMGTTIKLQIPFAEKVRREALMRDYTRKPHVIILRATESALRLADVQDEPRLLKDEMSERVSASGEPNTDALSLGDYFMWLQKRLAQNLKRMHAAGFVHRALYHGGNVTTNGEIVDLDTLRRPVDYDSHASFIAACRRDIADVAKNIVLLQQATDQQPDTSEFHTQLGS